METSMKSKLFNQWQEILAFIIASVLFSMALYYSREQYELSIAVFVGYAFYFIVFLEISRAIVEYVFDGENRIKVKYIYDTGIVFTIRELLVTTTINHHKIIEEIVYICVMSAILILLAILRYVDYKYNPKNLCEKC
jgi:uncharacterized membrane protein (DUF373 family)